MKNSRLLLAGFFLVFPFGLHSQSAEEKLHVEQTAETQRGIQEIESVIKDATETSSKAKNPVELDVVIAKLGRYKATSIETPPSPALSSELQDASDALNFAKQWQEYLAIRSSGVDSARALDILKNLAEQSRIFLVPRSEILAHLYRPPEKSVPKPASASGSTIKGWLDQIKSLEDLGSALEKIESESDPVLRRQVSTAMVKLLPIEKNYRAFLSGQPINVEFSDLFVPPGRLAFRPPPVDYAVEDITVLQDIQELAISLREKLLTLSLPRYLGLPETVSVKPDETRLSFLERIKTDALARGDYLLAAKAEGTRSFLRTGNREHPEAAQASLFITANRQAAAQQHALSVDSYERALSAGSDLIPAKEIGRRLEEIKAQHPQEFQQGMDMYQASPQTPVDRGPFNQRMMQGRGLGGPVWSERPALQIPAVIASPSPAPTVSADSPVK